ncbi:alpha/beta hydrolase [Agromyces kandeliae]|uniref:Alpha/beta hydrolase fold domain-containing protein n=1 Tax=Agromyces kandeliae TaxID=2666141 RepID=A0A6L5QZ98_9MICO|nr:alpha/beta fold hydrolase [Agromyces kandeliae]MRX43071.1 alpha/beta hydrolase fold domain-containing protein [Agromyces kandeliae]
MTDPYDSADGLVRVYPAGATTAGTAGTTPALVWAHGGGFVAGDLDMPEADWVARSFAARGVTVVSIDYRLAGGGCRYPDPSDDVLAAWRWTSAHAGHLGIDPARIVAGGASAGGNLTAGAVLRALDGAAPVPAGVFLAYPILLAVQPAPDAALRAMLDANPAADRFGPARVRAMYEDFLGGPVDDAPLPAVPGRATPEDVAGYPPVLMVNGEADELRVSGEAFAATLVAAGVPVMLVTEPGTEHGHLNRPDEPAASATVDRAVRWIDDLDRERVAPRRPEGARGARPGGQRLV